MHHLAQEFIRTGGRLRLSSGPYEERPDVASKAIFIEGNVEGFRSLTELIALYLNELEDLLPISKLPFVLSELSRPFALRISYGDQKKPITHGAVLESDGQLEWNLTEAEASIVATSIHGLGYAYEHLHFDPTNKTSEYAVYCGRIDE